MRVSTRDVQKSKVYAWERVALPGFTTKNMITSSEVRRLIARVQNDVEAAGGFVNKQAKVAFTKRAGGACASWRILNFTPLKTSYELVLHELAHHLTYNFHEQYWAGRAMESGAELSPFATHMLKHFDAQGHGPKFVACYIALLERYADKNASALLRSCYGFETVGWGKWRVTGSAPTAGGTTRVYKERTRVTKKASIKCDLDALKYWRDLLKGVV